MTVSRRIITMQEVEAHNTPDDLWFVIDNKVYDMSSYLPQHPGGVIMLSGAGADCTVMFHHYHYGAGLDKAVSLLKKREIGSIAEKASPIMGPFYEDLSCQVAQALHSLPRHPLKAQIMFFVDVFGVLIFTLWGVYLSFYHSSTSRITIFVICLLDHVFANRAAAQAHAVGHMQVFDKHFVSWAEYIMLLCGRTMPVYALPSETVVYRHKLNRPRAEAQAEFSYGRGPFEHQALHHVRGAELEHDECKNGATILGLLRLRSTDPYKWHHFYQKYALIRNIKFAVGSLLTDLLVPMLKIRYIKSMLLFYPIAHPRILLAIVGAVFECMAAYVAWILPLRRDYVIFMILLGVRQMTHVMLLFFAQHDWDSQISEDTANLDWGRYNTITSISLHGESFCWWHPLLLGGDGTSPSTLTYHLEHTLFPGVNYLYLNKVAVITERVCKKYNIR
jgi:hypothetical protein